MTNAPGIHRSLRSYLYVPGDSGRRLDRVEMRQADAVIVDLEDSVLPARKSGALDDVLVWLNSKQGTRKSRGQFPERWVRINAGHAGLHELDQLAHDQLRGVVVPKVTSPADLTAADKVLTAAEGRKGLPTGAIAFMPLIETAEAVVNIRQISRASRVVMLQLGEVDLAADLGIEPSDDEAELAAIRSSVVVVSRASALAAPVGPVSTNYSDLPLFRRSTEQLRRLGFVGRAAIHPAQLPIIHETFSPTAEEVAFAREQIQESKFFTEAGQGAWISKDGKMIDEAVLRRARRILDVAETSGSEQK